MEEYCFGHRETAAHENLIDVRRPVWIGRVAQIAIEGEILSPPSQSRRGEETRIGIGSLPFGQKKVVQQVGRDEAVNRSQRVDLAL